jgi:UDP-N-acetylglucosamine--N-acetylmuramyl-(pentapeptide) pyrophosphoryl-undecaprenol N-acetylglucosamine transferase
VAVAEAVRKLADEHKLYFVGTRGGGGFERRLVEAAEIKFDAFDEVFAGPIVGVNFFRAFLSMILMGIGLLQSIVLLLRYRPQVILFTGGWANVPVALAGWLLRVPMLVYLPDIEPGSTIRVLGRFVQKIATTVPESAQFFREGQTVTTGYPLRSEVSSATRDAAIKHFKLDPSLKTILVTGGSRGARSINIAIENSLNDLLKEAVQVIHVTGELDWVRSQAAVKGSLTHYYPFEYLDSHEMGLAFAAADIVVGRSGASALGEFPYFGAASILVPYPYAWRYQRVNADWLAERGAGIRMNDEAMVAELLPTLQSLVRDAGRLKTMQDCAKAVYQGDGSANIARELLSLAGEK